VDPVARKKSAVARKRQAVERKKETLAREWVVLRATEGMSRKRLCPELKIRDSVRGSVSRYPFHPPHGVAPPDAGRLAGAILYAPPL
jgi:hypothetical protein